MTTVKDIMTVPVVVVAAEDTTAHIAEALDHHRISAVPVVDDQGGVIGVVSEFDLLAKVGGTAGELMSTAVISVSEDTAVDDVRHLRVDRRIHRVPVVSGGTVVGIVSRADTVALLFAHASQSRGSPSMRCGRPDVAAATGRGVAGYVRSGELRLLRCYRRCWSAAPGARVCVPGRCPRRFGSRTPVAVGWPDPAAPPRSRGRTRCHARDR